MLDFNLSITFRKTTLSLVSKNSSIVCTVYIVQVVVVDVGTIFICSCINVVFSLFCVGLKKRNLLFVSATLQY